MVLFMAGMPCAICHEPIGAEESKVGFSPFVGNEADPLFRFNDSVVHSECLRRDPLGLEAQERHAFALAQNAYASRVCLICGQHINNPNEYFGLGFLTNDSSDELHCLNFKHFHSACLPLWDDLERVHALAADRLRTGKWRGRAMQRLEETLRKAIELALSKDR
jgi:hypothetical protein